MSLRKLGSEKNIVKNSRNNHVKMIEKNVSKEPFNSNCLHLATSDNKVLNSFRNGPIRPSFNPGLNANTLNKQNTLPVKTAVSTQKRQRPPSAKHERQPSPGMNGKLNTYKTYDHQKGKAANTMIKPQHSKTIAKSIVNSMSLKGIVSAKPMWKQ